MSLAKQLTVRPSIIAWLVAVIAGGVVVLFALNHLNCRDAQQEAERNHARLRVGMTLSEAIATTGGHSVATSSPVRTRLLLASAYPCEYWVTLTFGTNGRVQAIDRPEPVDVGTAVGAVKQLQLGAVANELQRTRDGNAAASPLNSVFDGRAKDDGAARAMAADGRSLCPIRQGG